MAAIGGIFVSETVINAPKVTVNGLNGEEILKHIEHEVVLYEEVLNCAKVMQKALIEHDVPVLANVTQEKESLLNELGNMERKRKELYPNDITSLIGELTPPISSQLARLREYWKETIKMLEAINFQNARLLISAMETTRTLLQGLLNGDGQKSIYAHQGAKAIGEPKKPLLNKSA